jgi:murein DD-endopeptidase MepM/ murein hydrolase activator NlpD
MRSLHVAVALVFALLSLSHSLPAADPILHINFDLNVGETQTGQLPGGQSITLKLVSVTEHVDGFNASIRSETVQIQLNGVNYTIDAGPYRLPVTLGGFQVDVTVTSGMVARAAEDRWGLAKRARLRVWPAGSSWLAPGTFAHPLRQRWFAGYTQTSNEPGYEVNNTTDPVYYHFGTDIGAAEGMFDVDAATSGTVVMAAGVFLSGYETHPGMRNPRPDVVTIMDGRNWFWRYSHLKDIVVSPGDVVQMGQKIALVGKEGPSGGWAQLHFDCTRMQPSGQWGIEDAYAFLWEGYRTEHSPQLIAVARPHQILWVGQQATLDASRSWGSNLQFQWTFTDGESATGAKVTRTYNTPGYFSEIVKVTDGSGNVDYDFAGVLVMPSASPIPWIGAAYAPTWGIKPGDPVTFKVRTFLSDGSAGNADTQGGETWDFGDGTPPVFVQSDGNVDPNAPNGFAVTTHSFAHPGHYLVKAVHTRSDGLRSTTRLHVIVEGTPVPPRRCNRLLTIMMGTRIS